MALSLLPHQPLQPLRSLPTVFSIILNVESHRSLYITVPHQLFQSMNRSAKIGQISAITFSQRMD